MALNLNMATSNGSGNDLSAGMQTYYDKKMILNMQPKLVHYQYGQKRPLPRNSGNIVSFRRWSPFDAVTGALTEGAVPEGQNLNLSQVTASVRPYGGYVAVSDVLDMTALDPVVNDAVELMADQGALSIDHIVAEELVKGGNVQYAMFAGVAATARHALTASHKLTSAELRRAVRFLKKKNAPQFQRGGKSYYVALVGPEAVYDLQEDSAWTNVSQYQDSEAIFSGEIGRLFGVIVVETNEGRVYNGADLCGASRTLTTASSNAWANGTKTLAVTATLTAADQVALVGRKILIEGEVHEIESAVANSLVLKTALGAALAAAAASKTVYPGEGGAAGVGAMGTLVFGRDAYGVVDLEGRNVRAIVKNRGSSGVSDPLDQIATVGWKVDGFACAILQEDWLLRIEHGFTPA